MFPSILHKVPSSTALLSAVCALLLSACGSGGEGDMSASADTTSPMARAAAPITSDCDKTNIQYMHEVYDLADRDSLAKIFGDHFQVDVAGTTVEMKDPVLRISWKSIEAAQKTVAKADKPVRGIYINYGLDVDKFHPIFEFMYPDPANGNLQVFAGKPFSFDGTDLKPETDPKKYTDAYFKDIRVDRTGSGSSALKDTGDEPDPLGTWYPYADKVNNLLEQNPVKDTVLVISCISQQLCYGALASLPAPHFEFRHLLALHVADGTEDKLTTGSFDPSKRLVDHAMDLGHLCPPNCSTGKP